MRLTIEPMEAADIDAVSELEQLCFPEDPWPREAYEEELARGARGLYFVVRAHSETNRAPAIIGNGGCRVENGAAHITTIALHPDWRGRHIGERLLFRLLDAARDADAKVVWLEVRESNRAALRLYRKHGFVVVGRDRRYYSGEAALVLRRSI